MHIQTWLRHLLQAATLLLCSFNLAHAGEPPAEPILRFDLGEHTATTWSIASDDAGCYVVTASQDKTARVWRVADGQLLTTLRIPIGSGNEGKLFAVALSPDGQTVALGGWAKVGDSSHSIFLFDRASGRLLRRLTGLPNAIGHLAFSLDGRSLAATLGDDGLRLFSVADGRLLAQDTDYAAQSYSVQFSPRPGKTQEQRLVTTSYDGALRLYRWENKQLTLLAKRSAPGGSRPFAARFSPDGTQIAVGFADTPAAFDSQHRAFVAEQALNAPILTAPGLNVSDWFNTAVPKLNGLPLKLKTNEMSRSLALLPDGSGFALGTEWRLRLCNRNGTQRWQQAIPDVVWAVNVSQDGDWVVAAYGDGSLRWHRASDGAEQLAFFPMRIRNAGCCGRLPATTMPRPVRKI